MSSHLTSERANLASLREALRRELFEVLDKCGVGPKALVWDEALIGRFGLIVDQVGFDSRLPSDGLDRHSGGESGETQSQNVSPGSSPASRFTSTSNCPDQPRLMVLIQT